MTSTIEVDDIWRALGKYKRYTIQQIFYTQFVCLYLFVFPVLVYVFVGYTPPHQCKPLTKDLFHYGLTDRENITYNVLSYEKCHTVLSVNISNITTVMKVPCTEGYDYDIEEDTFVTEWNLVCGKAGLGELTQTLWTAGELVGAFIFPSISDRYGRKPICICTMFIVVILSVAAMFSNNYITYIVLRTIIGAFQEGAGLTLFVYVLEQVPTENRSFISALGSVSWGINVTVMAGLGYLMRNLNWRYVQMVSGLVGIHVIGAYWILDESLRWLVANKRMKQATVMVRKIAKINNIKLEDVLPLLESKSEVTMPLNKLDEVNGEQEQPHLEKTDTKENFLTVLTNRSLLKISAIMTFIWITHSLVYYGLTFNSVQMAGNRFLNFFITVAIDLPAVLSYMFLVKRSIGFGIGLIAARIGGMFAPYTSFLTSYIEWGPGIIFGVFCVISTLLQLLLPETSGKELPQSIKELTEWNKQLSYISPDDLRKIKRHLEDIEKNEQSKHREKQRKKFQRDKVHTVPSHQHINDINTTNPKAPRKRKFKRRKQNQENIIVNSSSKELTCAE
ncbi:SLC22A4_5 [Mytilus coruscus]|uniref:SLC22A4_5 n=1 Tax=Mytilus coruscus TaxID=42192 RepID=A0A6J8F138_MYTCO|nr:SLC22A4_5 [Mytilus coruscus]